MARLLLAALLSCAWLCRPCLVSADSTGQFKEWYPEFRPQFETILRGNCSSEYEKYLTVPKKDAPIDWFTGGGNTNRLAQPVTNCILEYSSEFIKSNMAAAAVVLGLMPTILATLGNSVEETSTLCVIAQRPLLALLVATGSPAIFPTRSFRPSRPMKLVKFRPGNIRPRDLSFYTRIGIMIVEYLVMGLAIANTMTLCKQLGLQAVSTVAPHWTDLQLVWSIIGIPIHVSAALSLWFRTQLVSLSRTSYALHILRQQFMPIDDTVWTMAVIGDETYLSVIFSYFTSLVGTCHVIYGTMLFSSLVFISAKDSLTVMSRYMASAMVSRIVLMYELHRMRGFINERTGGDVAELTHVTGQGGPITRVTI